MTTFPFVLRFAEAMERKLAKNRHKGDADGWRALSRVQLYRMLRAEVDELIEAIESDQFIAREVLNEAADVGNIAMMLADHYQHHRGQLL